MDILIFSAIYPAPADYKIPNDTKVVHYYAKQWKDEGHNVQVVYLHMIPFKKMLNINNLKKLNGYEADYEFEGINVHLLEYQLLVPKTNYLTGFQAKNAEKRVEQHIAKLGFEYDKVFVHFPCSFKSVRCLTKFKCPTMAVLHNIDVQILKKKGKLVNELKPYTHIGGRNKKICDAVSKFLSRESDMVLSGIDESLIAPFDLVEKKASSITDVIKIVYAGNLIKLKNVDILLKALSKVDFEYQCDIIGDGVEREYLQSMVENNSKIAFRGRMSRQETINKMRDANIFVMVSSPETFGLVYLEAMAQGCIVIGSKNEGIDGVIIDGKNGFLVEPRNIDELVECLNRINAMRISEKKTLIFSAYQNVVEMTDANMAKKYLQLNK